MASLTSDGRAAHRAQSSLGLEHLIDPFDPADFARDYWEQRPLLVSRQDPRYYADLLTLDGFDAVLSTLPVRSSSLRIVAHGKESEVPEGPNALESLYAQYRDGSTIIASALNERWEPLQRLCRALAAETGNRHQVNVYLTPAGSQGFVAHYDTHDVFIAQVHGTKHWRLYDSPLPLPLRNQPHQKNGSSPGQPTLEFDLRAGDLVYIPRGWVHDATSNETASLHLTIGAHSTPWANAIEESVKQLVEKDFSFRRSLPFGFAGDDDLRREAERTAAELLDLMRIRLSAVPMLASAAKSSLASGGPALRHHLTDLEAVESIGLDTVVRRRTEARQRMTALAGCDVCQVTLDFQGRSVQFPPHVASELRYVAESDELSAASIPGELDEPGRLLLVKTLVREGFLTIA
jgi:ribosomal protein L16 Arg81 hydroxylase